MHIKEYAPPDSSLLKDKKPQKTPKAPNRIAISMTSPPTP